MSSPKHDELQTMALTRQHWRMLCHALTSYRNIGNADRDEAIALRERILEG
jgi:hypothetical protein